MHLYSTLLCIAVHPKTFTIMWGGGVSSTTTRMMQRQPQDNGASALTTHQLQVERRESHRANQVDGNIYIYIYIYIYLYCSCVFFVVVFFWGGLGGGVFSPFILIGQDSSDRKWSGRQRRSRSQDSNPGHLEHNDTICWHAARNAISTNRSKHSNNKPGLPYSFITGISYKNENPSFAST